ncbi:MAG: SET domain-containing protein-lysine N-methyltransferase, partial [Cycloclasticus sp.]|nr:SET domain-containing protein-lysine N-methyltransferase [Cycloclasticus sp.]
MINTLHSADVYIKDTGTIKGRGAFANRDFAEGEIVEQCPIIILLRPYDQLPPRLKTMVFNWGNLASTTPSHALALGFGSLYNHDNPANLRYQAVPDDEAINYIATRAIKKDEELTINYNAGGGSHLS